MELAMPDTWQAYLCTNPETYERMSEDIDVDAGRILTGDGTRDELAAEICALAGAVGGGRATASAALAHRELVLGYKSCEPIGPACHPSPLVMAG